MRLVMAVIVDAVQGMLRRGAVPHVGVKLSERSTPTRTHANPAAPVIRKAVVLRVFAPLDHVRPRPIFGRAVLPVRPLVNLIPFSTQTSARLSIAHFQIMGRDVFQGSAVAETLPFRAFAGVSPFGWLQREQSTEAVPLQICPFGCHKVDSTLFGVF